MSELLDEEMTLIAEFIIEDMPKLPNTQLGRHWSAKHKERVKWGRLINEKCDIHKIRDIKLTKAQITFTRHSSRECDFDNLVSSFKPVTDALIVAGVIIDDKPSVIGQSQFRWLKRHTKQGGMITVRIEA